MSDTQRTSDSLSMRITEWGDLEVITADGRKMFEVCLGKDARSIDVRAVDVCKVNGVVYNARLEVRPSASNSIRIGTVRYDDEK